MPAGYAIVRTTTAPWLSVRNGVAALEFYKTAFGATEACRIDIPDGVVVAKLSVDGAEFWLGEESPRHSNFTPASPRRIDDPYHPDHRRFRRVIRAPLPPARRRCIPSAKNMAGGWGGWSTLRSPR